MSLARKLARLVEYAEYEWNNVFEEEDMEEFVSIPSIVLIVYMIIEVIKICTKNEVVSKLFPAISCVLGMGLGILAFYLCPAVIPANNVLSAILIGGSSGLSATGTNQIIKQLTQKNDELKHDEGNTETTQDESKTDTE